MLEFALFTVAIAAGSLLLQDRLGIPTPITIISCIVMISVFGHRMVEVTEAQFDELIFLMLPILICSDALALRWDEIKRNAISLAYVAGIMIVLSVAMAIALNSIILPDYNLAPAAVAALFCMVLATDPVTVTSVFGRFHLPHNLKVLAEGESLFNDASALIVFSIALTYMGINTNATEATPNLALYSLQMVGGAALIGFMIGWLGLKALCHVHDAMTETMIIIAMALAAFAIAEHFHASGILAVIVAILFGNSVITKRLREPDQLLARETEPSGQQSVILSIIGGFDLMAKDAAAYRVIIGNIQFVAILAATVLFITMANLIQFELLITYWKEIAAVFIGTTFIRMVMLGAFARISRFTDKVVTIPLHWWKILAFAGVKGAFSILMLHMLPRDFAYLELFEAVVVGNILLSTFLYPLALVAIIRVHKHRFEEEYQKDHMFEE